MMPSRKALEETAPKADDDATVMMTRDALKKPEADPESTVMMTRDALKEPDEDATVTIPAGALKAAAAAAAMPPAAFKSDSDPDATATGAKLPPSILTQEPSRMPVIAGGAVVVLVILYFALSGGKGPAPEATQPAAPKPETAASAPAPATTPASPPSPAAPAATTQPPAAATPAAPAASTAPVAAGAAPAGSSLVKERLAAEIKRGAVAVSEDGAATTITMSMTHQFASGGVDPEAHLRTLLQSIAAALDKVPGSIVVTGHADAKPSSNPKFPSNQALSEARAQSAAKVMAGKLGDPKRVTSEGASDSKPLAASDTNENRAKNRRVVITVKP
jgi:flagellar motor protein MotB